VSTAPQSNWFTLDEYFALERASERRFEFRDGEVVCMSGGRREHAAIARNIVRYIKLREGCQVYGSDMALYVPGGLPYRYPDASVVCGKPQVRDVNGRDCIENPALIMEVLSPSTADFDRGTKFEQYKSIPDFLEYLLIAQDRPHVAWRRKQDDGTWNEQILSSLDAVIHLQAGGVILTMREVYEDVSFE
jgi:Uma2 family endonuclease